MSVVFAVTPARLADLLLHVAVVRPVFVWGAPGIGKSSLVRAFAESLALPCVTLVGTQLAAARVVFCDAAACDAGFVNVEDIAGRVRVRGRGGTGLQPGVDLLERADDFPKDGPILVITDGDCGFVRVRREHAFLVPQGKRLPFTPRGEVFAVR